jgi:hypothetical protein
MHQEPNRERDDHRSIVLTPNSPPAHNSTPQGSFAASHGQNASRKEAPTHIAPATNSHQQIGSNDSNMASLTSCLSNSAQRPHVPSSQGVSDGDLIRQIESCIEEMVDRGRQNGLWCFRHASTQPPITSESLMELDMPRIINNPKLRHDVNFDRDLHFRPNLDGSKGKQKMLQADQYWKALEVEFAVYAILQQRRMQSNNEPHWHRSMKLALKRLPNVFIAIRDILKTLVPDQDQRSVTDRLDVPHLVEQVHNGVCDLVDLANWLGKILKNHCAPMRDCLVDSMQKTIVVGATEGRADKLVSGLRSLMTILEAMKLDVANHQIRHMRPLLIEDTINFQRKYNAHRLFAGKIDGPKSRLWLQNEMEMMSSSPLDALVSATIRDLLLYNSSSLPSSSTFYLDVDRLRTLRTELLNSIYLDLCRHVMRDVLRPDLSQQQVANACSMLSQAIPSIVGSSSKFLDRSDYVAVEIVRIVMEVEQRPNKNDLTLLGPVEQMLADALRPDSRAFAATSRQVMERLTVKVQARVRENIRSSALTLQDSMVPAASAPRPATGFGAVCDASAAIGRAASQDPDENIIRRITHILVLHWQVWADILYLLPSDRDSSSSSSEDSEGDDSDGMSTIMTSAAASPTLPVAEALFAPGHKFLAVNIVTSETSSLNGDVSAPSPLELSTPAPLSSMPTQDEAMVITSTAENLVNATPSQQPATFSDHDRDASTEMETSSTSLSQNSGASSATEQFDPSQQSF